MHRLFWAKTGTRDAFADRPRPAYKPVGHHLLDVAAAAGRFLAYDQPRLRRERAMSGLGCDQHLHLCSVLAALHDLGKISPWFQAQVPEFWPAAALGPVPAAAARISHWEATALLLGDAEIGRTLGARLPDFALDIQTVAAVAGHHGRAPAGRFLDGDKAVVREFVGESCLVVARHLCAELVALLVPAPLEEPEAPLVAAFSFSLNGLITLADWVGSDSDAFPFEDPRMPLAEYWPIALVRADRALQEKGLVPAASWTAPALSGISRRAGANPRPMQKVAAELAVGERPQLVLIEDGTGSGKTEAALLLAARMMAAGLGEGLYVALPTMATANAMHQRLETAMLGLFNEKGGRPASLVLAHGKAGLAIALERHSGCSGGQAGEETVSNRFNLWIGDSRKKAFFADAGAGTIDQVFLAVLPKKHLTLRQYALAGRTLLVDEAHACDSYMGEELKTLVEMQARLGGSIVILSATLREEQRRELILAFAAGRGMKDRDMGLLRTRPLSAAYPLLTHYSGGDWIEEIPVQVLAGLSRSVGVERIADRAASVAQALKAAARGACAAIICNAVDSAIEVYRALIEAGHPVARLTLFHARFAIGDRMEIEEKVLRLFGPDSMPETRAGQILVATQVVEQSLDLDFDVMISDLAPVDLLIQRAGRLWRHDRAARPISSPVLQVVAPDPSACTEAGWLADALGPSAYTYKLPGVLWRTARDLFARGHLDTPADLRFLVESAYRPDGNDLPEILTGPHQQSVGERFAAQYLGQHNTIEPRAGYACVRDVSVDEEIGTRLGERSVTLRLGKRLGSRLEPLISRARETEAVNWALSEISVRYRWLTGKGSPGNAPLPTPSDPAVVGAVRAGWPEWERDMPLYEVDEDGRLKVEGRNGLVYDSKMGLVQTK